MIVTGCTLCCSLQCLKCLWWKHTHTSMQKTQMCTHLGLPNMTSSGSFLGNHFLMRAGGRDREKMERCWAAAAAGFHIEDGTAANRKSALSHTHSHAHLSPPVWAGCVLLVAMAAASLFFLFPLLHSSFCQRKLEDGFNRLSVRLFLKFYVHGKKTLNDCGLYQHSFKSVQIILKGCTIHPGAGCTTGQNPAPSNQIWHWCCKSGFMTSIVLICSDQLIIR